MEVRIVIPDFDPESILPASSIDVPIDRRQQEFVASLAVDGAGPFVLRPSAGDNEPVVLIAVEVEVRRLELELGVARRHGCAFLILGNETKSRSSD